MRASCGAVVIAALMASPATGQTLNGALAGAGTIPGVNPSGPIKVLPVRGNIYLSVLENIPAMPSVLDYRFTLCGDLAIAERTVEYGGNSSYNTAISEMEDGKVKRARQCFAAPFEAPQWRARWVERM